MGRFFLLYACGKKKLAFGQTRFQEIFTMQHRCLLKLHGCFTWCFVAPFGA